MRHLHVYESMQVSGAISDATVAGISNVYGFALAGAAFGFVTALPAGVCFSGGPGAMVAGGAAGGAAIGGLIAGKWGAAAGGGLGGFVGIGVAVASLSPNPASMVGGGMLAGMVGANLMWAGLSSYLG